MSIDSLGTPPSQDKHSTAVIKSLLCLASENNDVQHVSTIMPVKSQKDKHGSSLGTAGVVVQFVNKFPDNFHLLLTGWICRAVLAHENEISFKGS